MTTKHGVTLRNFQIVEVCNAHGQFVEVQASSAIDDTERGVNHPGSSYLWIGAKDINYEDAEDFRGQYTREEVRELRDVLTRWLVNGNLSEAEGYD